MKTTEEMIASTERYIAKLEAARKEYESTLPAHGYLVIVGNDTLTFDIENGEYVNPRYEKPHKALRFGAIEAARLARKINTYDGEDKIDLTAGVVHVWEAIAYWIEPQRKHLAQLRASASKAP